MLLDLQNWEPFVASLGLLIFAVLFLMTVNAPPEARVDALLAEAYQLDFSIADVQALIARRHSQMIKEKKEQFSG